MNTLYIHYGERNDRNGNNNNKNIIFVIDGILEYLLEHKTLWAELANKKYFWQNHSKRESGHRS